MRRRLWIIVIVVVLLAVTADTLVWRFAEIRLRAGVDDWITAQRAAGWTVAVGELRAGGWPLAATIGLSGVTLRGGEPTIPGGLSWQPDRVVLGITIQRPATLEISASGAGHLRISGGPDIPYTADRLLATLPLTTGPVPEALDVQGEKLRMMLPAGALEFGRLGARVGLNPFAGPHQAAVSVGMDMTAIELPEALTSALGPRIASLSVDAALNGPLRAEGGLRARASAWRDDGGTLEVRKLTMAWGPFGLLVTATLGLDSQLQPAGAGIARVQGYAETADALAARGLMTRSAAVAAKAVLSLLARAPGDGGPSQVEVPLSLQDRTVSMRQVPLVQTPELDWPQQ